MNEDRWDLRRQAENTKKTMDSWPSWAREQGYFAGSNRSPKDPVATEKLVTAHREAKGIDQEK